MDNIVQILEGLADTRGGGRRGPCLGCGVSGGVGGLGAAPGAPVIAGMSAGTLLAVGAAVYFLFFRKGARKGQQSFNFGRAGRHASGSIIPR